MFRWTLGVFIESGCNQKAGWQVSAVLFTLLIQAIVVASITGSVLWLRWNWKKAGELSK